MSLKSLALPTLAALCAMSAACSDTSPPTSPAGAPSDGGPEMSLFGLGGPAAGCRTAPYRQFDFWVGSWEVTAGAPTKGASFVTSEVGGCAIMEDWHGAFGGRGRSLNAYDASDGQWHQQWVENSGFYPLRLDGGIANGAMVMQGSYPDPRGTPTVFTVRYAWTPLGPDDARQRAEQSTDGGVTFPAVTFDGHYHRNPTPVVPTPNVLPYCNLPVFALFREFDFTLGDWSVELDGPGAAAAAWSKTHPARSEIRTDLDGCLYEEKLTGVAGYEARVFTNIRPLDEIWQRTYVDNRGLRLYVTGPRMQEGKIVLTGTMPAPGGGTQPVRATFEPTDADHFVERWERGDGGGWAPLVTATYSR